MRTKSSIGFAKSPSNKFNSEWEIAAGFRV
jgi:hypothetical protein